MKAILSICLIATLLVQAATASNSNVTGCSVKLGNETASMEYFVGNSTVGTDTVDISPCGIATFRGCTPSSGYLAIYDSNGNCSKVYNTRTSASYNNETRTFQTVFAYSADHSFHYQAVDSNSDAADVVSDSITVDIQCSAGVEGMTGIMMKDGSIKYKSETVCAMYWRTVRS